MVRRCNKLERHTKAASPYRPYRAHDNVAERPSGWPRQPSALKATCHLVLTNRTKRCCARECSRSRNKSFHIHTRLLEAGLNPGFPKIETLGPGYLCVRSMRLPLREV